MLRRIAEDEKPDYFAVVFDAPGKTFRDDWYPQYKAQRPSMPEDLARQIEPLHELVRAHGWPLLMVEGVEADDVIGTLAVAAAAAGIDCVISTSDKDLAQLVRPGIKLVNTMSNETLDEAGVLAKFGVRADQVLDLLALTGDAVDNVPGVPKVGPKTAAKWLTQYGTLDAVIGHAGEVPGVVGENLRATLDWLPQGKRLLTVKTDCELAHAPTDLALQAADAERLKTLYERFEFKQWLRDGTGRDSRADSARAAADRPSRADATAVEVNRDTPADVALASADRAGRSLTRPFDDPGARAAPADAPPPVPRHYETVTDEAALERWLGEIERAELVCFDTETTGLDPMRAKLVGLSFAIEPGVACYIPLAHRYPGVADQLPLRRDARALRAVVRECVAQESGAERQVRPARARQPRSRASRRRSRHAASILRARGAPSARHGQSRVAPLERQDDDVRRGRRQGREADRLRPGEHRRCDGVLGRRYRHRAAAASLAPSTRGCRSEARPRLHDDRNARARSALRHGARRRHARRGAPCRAKRRARHQGDGSRAAGVSARRAAVQPRFAEAAGRDPVRQDEAADGAQDGHRAAVDR